MKPIYLEFCGVNSFSEKTVIDFGKLLGGGLFGIFGDTGSGKSTILDCIHFALYGKIDRSSNAESINYKCDKAYVVYDFEITHDGCRHAYRVQRERRRKNNVSKASLYEYDGEKKLQGLAEGVGEVDRRLEKIIGLGFEDFKKCIALPQGEFSGLVKAKPSERLQLVSRLFDLEKYGEKLSESIRAKYTAAKMDAELLRAKMGENEDGTEEKIAVEREKLSRAKADSEAVNKALAIAETELSELRDLFKEKGEYDRLCAALKEAEEKLPYYLEQREKAEKFAVAADIKKKTEEMQKASAEKTQALAESEALAAKLVSARTEAETLKRRLRESDFDRELEENLRIQGLLEAAKSDFEACEEAKKRLEACTNAYRKIKDKVPEEDFARLLAENEAEKEALGKDESFTEFLKRHFKTFLTAEAYGEFREDLKALREKYPQTDEDVSVLLEKYAASADGVGEKGVDIAAAQAEFKRIEQRRKALTALREEIEKRKRAYEENEQEKKRIVEDGKHFRERTVDLEKKIESVKALGTPEEIKRRIVSVRKAKEELETAIKETDNRISSIIAGQERLRGYAEKDRERETDLNAQIGTLLRENGFESASEACRLVLQVGDGKRVKEECEGFFADYKMRKRKYSEIPEEKFSGVSEEKLSEAEKKKSELSLRKEELLRTVAVGEKELERLNALKEKYKSFEKDYKAKNRECELWDKLRALTFRGRFMEFIASEYLQEVCAGASKTLLSLTGGRYFLKYGEEFKVGDNFNGGDLRSVKTLSGGETFLVSLSLALALSGAICAKSLRPIEFFFLDEGFGTLDEKLVDVVMDVLEKLRSRNFSIGVISHVEELKHRIDNKILVSGATDTRGSSVRIEAY